MKNKIKLEQVQKYISLTVKGLSVVALATGIYISGSLYNEATHSGPSCDLKSMQFWYTKANKKGKLVSIHKAKVQPIEGSTTCYGTALKPNGEYTDWRGVVTSTSVGDIGFAK